MIFYSFCIQKDSERLPQMFSIRFELKKLKTSSYTFLIERDSKRLPHIFFISS